MALVAGSLVVPIVVWGKKAPIHRISAVCALPNRKVIITGTHDGQICLWTVDQEMNLNPKYLLLGHVTSILCLVPADVDENTTKFISSAQSGKMCLWDSADGRCIESTMSSYVHTFAQPHLLRSGTTSVVRLFCAGHYSEILVLDPQNLQPLFALASRVEPDWISAFCIVKPPQKSDIVVGVSNAGVVKIWSLSSLDNKSVANPLYEDESKQVQCYSARDLVLCPYNPRSMLIVCSKIWQVFDAYDFSLICSSIAPDGHRWIGGAFTRLDRLVTWCSNGMAYLYQLPKHASLGNIGGQAAAAVEEPLCYCILKVQGRLSETMRMDPAFSYRSYDDPRTKDPSLATQIVLRGDSFGNLALWHLPDVSDKAIMALKQEKFETLPELGAKVLHSLQTAWKHVDFPTNGIIGHFDDNDGKPISITTTLYVPSQGRLVLGRDDGSIIIVAATHTLMRQFLDVTNRGADWPLHRVLLGHDGAVTCLLYPHEENPRYELNHLISGGADFCVRLWDLHAGALIHRFCVQAGEIMRLIVPPESCNPKVLQSICSVASDHSVALLGVKDLRCNLLASRHLFPIKDIRWRPLDDFLLVQCEDGTVYVWQMETGHLDRVLNGIVAEEVLFACQEQMAALGEAAAAAEDHQELSASDQAFAMARSVKAAASGKQTLPRKAGESGQIVESQTAQSVRQELNLAPPMLVQGVRCSGHDAEFHLVLFNVESLIMSLLVDEYGLARNGVADTTTSQSDSNTLSGFLAKAKETAGNVLKVSPLSPRKSEESKTDDKKRHFSFVAESNLNMEIAQLILSILHGWELDSDLDRVCSAKLGLVRPKTPLCFGLISREGHLSLLLPTAVGITKSNAAAPPVVDRSPSIHFCKSIHWQISSSMSTQHLLAIIAVANTLMSMNNAGFLPDHENKRRIVKRLSANNPSGSAIASQTSHGPLLSSEMLETLQTEQAQVKQGWSLLAAMHCVLLPELIEKKPSNAGVGLDGESYQPPRIELLARRWQERCLELREAAQALLLRELSRIGADGRKALIDKWAPYLPTLVDPSLSILGPQYMGGHPSAVTSPGGESTGSVDMMTKEGQAMKMATPPEPMYIGSGSSQVGTQSGSTPPSLQQIRRNQATSVVLLGVIGAEYGQEIPHISSSSASSGPIPAAAQRHPPQGFSKTDYSLARATSQSLLELMLQPPSQLLPPYSSLRRAAIDLLGRGFVVWQPYLDISKVLLALLELCSNAEKLLPNGPIHFPLNPQADACRTGRYALALIATARPPAFITALSKEVARFNTLAQHQTVQHISSPLVKAKNEILRVIEMLSDKQYPEIVDMMLPIGEILVHCLDTSLLKQKSLGEVFPAVTRFGMISYCGQTRRIAFGGKNGSLIIHEVRAGKAQTVQAHSRAVTACAFSDDGKYIATYSADEGKLNVWQMSQSFMGMGQSQIKFVRQLPAPTGFPVSTPGGTPQGFRARLMWMNPKSVTLLLPTGAEHRFAV